MTDEIEVVWMPQLLLVTSTIPPSPGPYPGPSVPAPTPELALAKDEDPKPAESPRIDSNSDITNEKVATASVAADEEMVDTVSTESKEEPMEVDGPQPSGMIIAAEAGSKENEASEVVSAGKEEWQLVDAADIPATETNEQSAPMVDRNEAEGGVAASRL